MVQLENCPNGMFRLIRALEIDSKEVEGKGCMSGSDGEVCFSEK